MCSANLISSALGFFIERGLLFAMDFIKSQFTKGVWILLEGRLVVSGVIDSELLFFNKVILRRIFDSLDFQYQRETVFGAKLL